MQRSRLGLKIVGSTGFGVRTGRKSQEGLCQREAEAHGARQPGPQALASVGAVANDCGKVGSSREPPT